MIAKYVTVLYFLQIGSADLYVRFVNYRDFMAQSRLYANPINAAIYLNPFQVRAALKYDVPIPRKYKPRLI